MLVVNGQHRSESSSDDLNSESTVYDVCRMNVGGRVYYALDIPLRNAVRNESDLVVTDFPRSKCDKCKALCTVLHFTSAALGFSYCRQCLNRMFDEHESEHTHDFETSEWIDRVQWTARTDPRASFTDVAIESTRARNASDTMFVLE